MLTPRSLRETNKRFIDEAVQAAFSLAERYPGVAAAWERLFHHVHQQTDLLHPRRKFGDLPSNGRYPLVGGLFALALHHADWLRPVETWKPTATSAWPQFTSMAQHLFAKYPIPVFMTSAWFGLPPGEKLIQHEWYKQLGLGASVRSLNIPLVLTKTMAHWFLQAPDHFSILAALRWGQVRGLGGSEALAHAVAATRLSKIREHDDFWISALRFFARHQTLELKHVGPIVDFLHHQRFQTQEVFIRGILVKQEPPQPEFSLKGRTMRSVLRLVDEWHKQLGRQAKALTLAWPRCRIGEFEYIEGSEHLGNMRRWKITELLNNLELLEEGRRMRHCVATYAETCAKRQTAIWSLKIEKDEGRQPVLTIEVDLATKTICQIRDRCNRLPKDHEVEIIRRWASREGIRMANLV